MTIEYLPSVDSSLRYRAAECAERTELLGLLPTHEGLSKEQAGRSAVRSAAAGATALVALAAVAALAFIAVAQAQQQQKKPAPAARPAPAPRAVARPPSPPPQRAVTRPSPPPQRAVTRPTPPQRSAIPNRLVTPPPRTALPNEPIGTRQSDEHAIPSGRQGPQGQTQVGVSRTGLKFGPHGPIATSAHLSQGPNALRRPKFPVVTVNNRYFPIVRGEKFMHVGGHRKSFVPLGALGAVLIGGSYWYPDGYVSTEAPLCTGYTPDGCGLHWRMVDFVDGGAEPQCVQYCPLAGPPPEQIATLPPPPPVPQGTCQLTIFSDPNFAGTSAPTADNAPNLSESGWQNEVSSIQVQSGTWDFFSDDDFGGNTMRLTAGTYPTLTPDWDKKINSFMCVEPGPGA
ncbi:MAG: beta/gamma crystallin-related protein [Xanthobacteraceae bacterium]